MNVVVFNGWRSNSEEMNLIVIFTFYDSKDGWINLVKILAYLTFFFIYIVVKILEIDLS